MARKYYNASFKAKVALEAVKEDAIVPQLAQKHGYTQHKLMIGNRA